MRRLNNDYDSIVDVLSEFFSVMPWTSVFMLLESWMMMGLILLYVFDYIDRQLCLAFEFYFSSRMLGILLLKITKPD